MGSGASKSRVAFDKSVNALRIIKKMQQPSDINDQFENSNSTAEENTTMPVAKVQNGDIQGHTPSLMEKAVARGKEIVLGDGSCDDDDQKGDVSKDAPKDGHAPVIKGETKDDDEDEGDKEPEVLTEEEIQLKIDKMFEKLSAMISIWSSVPVRDRSQEGDPYTKEFRQFALKLSASYFHFKPGKKIPYFYIADLRLRIARHLVNEKCVEGLCDVITEGLDRRDFYNEEGKTKLLYFFAIKNCVLTLLNYSDASKEVKLSIGSHKHVLCSMAQLAKDWKDKHLQKELDDKQDKLLKWIISIFHNCATMDENVPIIRDLDFVQIVLPYLDSPVSTMRLGAVSILADIVNEEEAELLQTNVSIFKFLLKTLGLALKDETHKNLGWSALELTRAVRQLARNDANKKILVDMGCLPLLNTLLKNGDENEIRETLDCLWILSFNDDNREAMMVEDDLVDHVVNDFHTCSGSTKYSCHGLLWSLKEHLLGDDKYKEVGNEVSKFAGQTAVVDASLSPDSPESPEKPQFQGHVMISYQWGNQETIKGIVKEMRAHSIPVWLDIDYMGGSTLQAMAKAVENSFLVIVAMSQKYKDSPNTRAEAEYAFQQRKTIIPLMMQRDYRPDGWLGLILGSKLFYDFSGKYSFESRMSGLLKAIQSIHDAPDARIREEPVIMTKAAALTSPTKPVAKSIAIIPHASQSKIKAWQSEDVKQWLAEFKLDNVASLMKLTGEEILFLWKLKSEAPEFFYHCLETKLGLHSILDLSRASEAFAGIDT